MELRVWGVGSPPPRISGINELGENREIIYGAQQVTGKILDLNELRSAILPSRTLLLCGLVVVHNAKDFIYNDLQFSVLGSLDYSARLERKNILDIPQNLVFKELSWWDIPSACRKILIPRDLYVKSCGIST